MNIAALLPFAEEHLEGALRLSQQMSWPYRLEDWAIAFELGHGFVLLDRAGSVIATAAWWPYGENQASAGMVIVSKAHQGRGHGARLMDALLAAAHPRTITLNSTAEGRGLYERRGFVRIGIVQQHQGELAGHRRAPPASLVRTMAAADAAAVAQLDEEATGWNRRPMLDRLLQAGDGHLLVLDGKVRGYAISRRFGLGYVIGPVVAERVADAQVLIEAALARIGPAFVRVDTPATTGLGGWLEDLGLRQVGDATTMVRGAPAAAAGPARLFALANQSFA